MMNRYFKHFEHIRIRGVVKHHFQLILLMFLSTQEDFFLRVDYDIHYLFSSFLSCLISFRQLNVFFAAGGGALISQNER